MTTPPKDKFPYELLHNSGCEGVLAYWRVKPVPGSTIYGKDFVWGDGRPPSPGELIICPQCKKPAWRDWAQTKNIRKRI